MSTERGWAAMMPWHHSWRWGTAAPDLPYGDRLWVHATVDWTSVGLSVYADSDAGQRTLQIELGPLDVTLSANPTRRQIRLEREALDRGETPTAPQVWRRSWRYRGYEIILFRPAGFIGVSFQHAGRKGWRLARLRCSPLGLQLEPLRSRA